MSSVRRGTLGDKFLEKPWEAGILAYGCRNTFGDDEVFCCRQRDEYLNDEDAEQNDFVHRCRNLRTGNGRYYPSTPEVDGGEVRRHC